jgi:hypothetical protein
MLKHLFLITICTALLQFAHAQTDSTMSFSWNLKPLNDDTCTMIKVYPNPARDNVFVSLREWDIQARYTLLLKDNKGRPVKSIVLLQRQQLIPIKSSYGKGMLWVEVWKEKQLLGRERLLLR